MVYIYKRLKKGLAPVARLVLGDATVLVESSEVQVRNALAVSLPRPVLESEWVGDDLIKKPPKSLEAHVVASLKRFLPRPYFASRAVPTSFQVRYTRLVEVPHAF